MSSSNFWKSEDKHCILITGGGSGIGLSLAKRFLSLGHEVVICGRRGDKLLEAKSACPALHVLAGDVETDSGRIQLVAAATLSHPKLNVLVNNAGVQHRLPPFPEQCLNPTAIAQHWALHKKELAINLEAPMHLSMLLLPHFLKKASSQIINVSAGLAFLPIAAMPTYCCSKAALHSYTQSLRQQLLLSSCGVVEIVPPAVDTDLGGVGLHTFGESVDAFSDHVFTKLQEGEVEFGFNLSEEWRKASREERQKTFEQLNSHSLPRSST